jgi:hypothetical protein
MQTVYGIIIMTFDCMALTIVDLFLSLQIQT